MAKDYLEIYNALIAPKAGYADEALLKELVEKATILARSPNHVGLDVPRDFMACLCAISKRIRENLLRHPTFIDLAEAFNSVSGARIKQAVFALSSAKGQRAPNDVFQLALHVVQSKISPVPPSVDPASIDFKRRAAAIHYS